MINRDVYIERWLREMPEDFRRRVIERLVPSDGGCLRWPGYKVGKLRYGRVRLPGALKNPGTVNAPEVLVHRAMWIHIHGAIEPVSLVVDHDDPVVGCKVRDCANVSHLRVTTQAINNTVAIERSTRTECPRGHDVVPGQGVCMQCKKTADSLYQAETRRLINEESKRLNITGREYKRRHGNVRPSLRSTR